MKFAPFSLLILIAALLCSQPAPREQVGPLPGGRFLLNSGWILQPAGRQIPLDTFPMSTALSRDGKFLLVLNGGYRPPSISVLETATGRELGRTPVADGWLGLTFSPKGDRVYVGGGSRAAVFEFAFANGVLQPARTFVVKEKPTNRDFIGDVALTPDGHLLFAADLYQDSVVVINTQSGVLLERFKTGRRPYRILFHPDGKSYFVTSWTDGALSQYETANGNALGVLRIGAHTTDMLWKPGKKEAMGDEPGWAARLFVTASNTNQVYTVAVTGSREMRMVEVLNLSFTARQPVGITPSALALGRDNRLYVVCSDANAVAVIDVSAERSDPLGFIPAGWYPTAARMLADGTLVVLNGRGGGSRPNPKGPQPVRRAEIAHQGTPAPVEYTPRIQTGTASWIAPYTDEDLLQWTKTVFENSPYRDSRLDAPNPFPPIEHVIYVVKENRTYDQVFGDMKQGNGDPSLVLFGEQVTPNHHKLAREFVLLDNFYVNSDVSADGHSWSTAAIAPDYIQRMWPNSYAARRRLYDYEGQEPTAAPPAGYLWTNAQAAGISLRNFGYFVINRPRDKVVDGVHVEAVRDPVLARATNLRYRGFDLDYPDTERARVFLAELAEWEKTGRAPRFILLRLGNDHTSGTAAGKIAPLSAVADNDAALGAIVEAVSRSRFWPKAAIFVLEDDAQNGPDHVDSHRSPAFVISPYARRGAVDSTMYNTTSMLRTMEMILGLRPMTQFDAGARPMSACFQPAADVRPYAAEKPRIPLEERNPAAAPGAARAARMDFSEADRIDDDELNDILWRAIRGTEPPAPVRSYLARTRN